MPDDIENARKLGRHDKVIGTSDMLGGGWALMFEWPWCATCATYTWAHSHTGEKTPPRYKGTPDDAMLAVLGLSGTPSKDEVRTAFRALMKVHHPDKGGDENVAKRIIAAYDELRSRGLAP